MSKYNSNEFVNAIWKKSNNFLTCPYCGGKNFGSTKEFATILVNEDLSDLELGPNIPAGILFCKNCGHMDFFALKALNLINDKEEKQNEK